MFKLVLFSGHNDTETLRLLSFLLTKQMVSTEWRDRVPPVTVGVGSGVSRFRLVI